MQQYCENGFVGTYGAADRRHDGVTTQGGYSSSIVVDAGYVLHVPESLDKAASAPLLCAGITTYSPLWHFGVKEGDSVGVVGLGGLEHMAVKLAKAMGAGVTVFTTSPGKVDAAKELGADHVVVSKDEQQMDDAANSVDVIIDAVAAKHDINDYLDTLRRDGAIYQLRMPKDEMPPIQPGKLTSRRLSYGGSMIGGIPGTQEMLDFCAEHNVVSDIEMVDGEQINEAYNRMVDGDVKYRFVLDTATL